MIHLMYLSEHTASRPARGTARSKPLDILDRCTTTRTEGGHTVSPAPPAAECRRKTGHVVLACKISLVSLSTFSLSIAIDIDTR